MQETTTAAARRRGAPILALLALAAVVVAVRSAGGQLATADGVRAGGPLTVNAGDTGLAFPAPAENRRWSATAGSFLLCGDGPITIGSVTTIRSDRTEGFVGRLREFRIRSLPGFDRVAEPILGGYGTPPLIGGSEGPADSRLLGSLRVADGARLVRLPSCDETTNLPGEDAVELLLTATAGPAGAHVDGVRVSYEAGGQQYEQKIAVELDLCGTASTSTDCGS